MPQKNSFNVKTFAIAPSLSIFITCWLVAFHSKKVLLYVTEQKQHKSDKNSGPLKLLQHEGRVGRMAFKISWSRILLSAGACAQEWETGVL